MQPVILIVH